MKKLGMNALLGVGQGSAAPPRLVEVGYAPRGARVHLALVGKGVVFDTREEVRTRAAMINQQVWVTRVMPPGNLTHITEDERRTIARWIKGGAQ